MCNIFANFSRSLMYFFCVYMDSSARFLALFFVGYCSTWNLNLETKLISILFPMCGDFHKICTSAVLETVPTQFPP